MTPDERDDQIRARIVQDILMCATAAYWRDRAEASGCDGRGLRRGSEEGCGVSDSQWLIRRSDAVLCDNGSGPEGALTPESPGLTHRYYSTEPRSEG